MADDDQEVQRAKMILYAAEGGSNGARVALISTAGGAAALLEPLDRAGDRLHFGDLLQGRTARTARALPVLEPCHALLEEALPSTANHFRRGLQPARDLGGKSPARPMSSALRSTTEFPTRS